MNAVPTWARWRYGLSLRGLGQDDGSTIDISTPFDTGITPLPDIPVQVGPDVSTGTITSSLPTTVQASSTSGAGTAPWYAPILGAATQGGIQIAGQLTNPLYNLKPGTSLYMTPQGGVYAGTATPYGMTAPNMPTVGGTTTTSSLMPILLIGGGLLLMAVMMMRK